MNKWLRIAAIAAAIIIVLVGGFYILNTYIYNEKQGDGTVNPYRGTLEGEYVCLPHKNPGEVQTMECMFGIKLDSGEHYAVNFDAMPLNRPEIETGDRFKAAGTITPIELISSDFWKIYDIEGIFSVTDSVEKL